MTFDLFGGRRLVLAGYRLGGFWIAAGVVALILLWMLNRAERRLVSRRAGLFLLALRLAAAVALVLALFEPIAARVYNESVRGRVIVAVDVSQSMETADPGRPAEARRELAKTLELSPGEPLESLTRREVARRLIDAKDAPIARLTADHAVDAFAFARTTAPASLAALGASLKNSPKADDPSSRVTDWQPALAEALRSGEAGAPVLGVVLVTDGRQNAPGDPMPVIDRLAARGVPVFPVLVGSTVPPRDAAIATIKAPETVYRGDVARIEATLKIDGYAGREIAVTLDRPGASPMQQTVRAPADGRTDRPVVTFQVPLEQVGTAALSLAIGPLEGDTRPDNDRRTVMIQVADDKANVLLVDGEARWEFRYLRNALARDPHVKATAVVFHQPGSGGAMKPTYETAFPARRDPSEKQPDPLGTFDAVIVGDVDPADLTSETWTRLESYVAERGGTLVLNPGPNVMGRAPQPGDGAQALAGPRPAAGPRRPVRDRRRAPGLAPRRCLAAGGREPRNGRVADAPARRRPRKKSIDLGRPPPAPLGRLGPGETRSHHASRGGRRRFDRRDRGAAVRTREGPVDRYGRHLAVAAPRRRRLPSSLLGTGGAMGHIEQAGHRQCLRPLRADPAANRGRRRCPDPGADQRRRPGRRPGPLDRRATVQGRSRIAVHNVRRGRDRPSVRRRRPAAYVRGDGSFTPGRRLCDPARRAAACRGAPPRSVARQPFPKPDST